MKITKIYFPMITVTKLWGEGVEPRYYTNFPGKSFSPSEDVIVAEEDWQKALEEAKEKGVRVETIAV